MKKGLKKAFAFCAAAAILCGAASLAACGESFTLPQDAPDAAAEVSSNGGFVVKKGEYVYFINGVDSYTSANDYGVPVKGSLMRIKEADLEEGKNTAEIVVPSLMVAGDYTSGIYIYGDRVYYATPNNMRNTEGDIENSYLDFKSAKLDGSDIENYFYLSDNSTQYRYVEVEGTVYLLYAGTVTEGNSSSVKAIISYNTESGTETRLVSNYLEFMFNSTEKSDPWVYYTMSVTDKADSDGPISYSYRQIYRARADWTKVPEGYAYGEEDFWDTEWLEENNAGDAPYRNLGEIVLDGRGSMSKKTPFNHSESDPSIRTDGYTYSLRSYTNDGIYFVRTGGQDGGLYYLPASSLGETWDSVKGNDTGLDAVANAKEAGSTASAAAIYLVEDKEGAREHSYIYVQDDGIYYAKSENGTAKETIAIAFDVSGATLVSVDKTSDENYKYVYFTRTNGNGTSVERAVYNGEEENYRNLQFEGQDDLKLFRSVKVLDVQHATGWYPYEVVDGILYYADSSTQGTGTYNYVKTVDLKTAEDALMNNKEIDAFNEKYNSVVGEDGLVETLAAADNNKLSVLVSYYFRSGSSAAFDENLKEAEENGQSETYLYSEEEKAAFRAFVNGEGYTDSDGKELFKADAYKDGDKSYRTISYFTTEIGKVSEDDAESIEEGWRNFIQRYTVPAAEEEGMEDWQIALIVIACALLAAGAAVAVVLVLRGKRSKEGERTRAPRMSVDTTDDKNVDVYSDEEEEPAEEPVEEPAEGPAEDPAEGPAEDPAQE